MSCGEIIQRQLIALILDIVHVKLFPSTSPRWNVLTRPSAMLLIWLRRDMCRCASRHVSLRPSLRKQGRGADENSVAILIPLLLPHAVCNYYAECVCTAHRRRRRRFELQATRGLVSKCGNVKSVRRILRSKKSIEPISFCLYLHSNVTGK